MYALIAESDELISLLIAVVLDDEGLCAHTATDSTHVLTAIQELPPAVILLDLSLCYQSPPLIPTIRSSTTHRIPIIGMAMGGLSATAVAQHGLDGFLAKPFHIDDLVVMVKPYLTKEKGPPG